MNIKIKLGNIIDQSTDAIINAANEQLLPGGGVCGAIHAAAGPMLAKDCAKLAPCPVGQARITRGHSLKSKYVIHAVGPVWKGGESGEREALESCYKDILRIAAEHKLGSITIPAISTGIYGYPLKLATQVALKTVMSWQKTNNYPRYVVFSCFDKETKEMYERVSLELLED